jgi:hypothetical protein
MVFCLKNFQTRRPKQSSAYFIFVNFAFFSDGFLIKEFSNTPTQTESCAYFTFVITAFFSDGFLIKEFPNTLTQTGGSAYFIL